MALPVFCWKRHWEDHLAVRAGRGAAAQHGRAVAQERTAFERGLAVLAVDGAPPTLDGVIGEGAVHHAEDPAVAEHGSAGLALRAVGDRQARQSQVRVLARAHFDEVEAELPADPAVDERLGRHRRIVRIAAADGQSPTADADVHRISARIGAHADDDDVTAGRGLDGGPDVCEVARAVAGDVDRSRLCVADGQQRHHSEQACTCCPG